MTGPLTIRSALGTVALLAFAQTTSAADQHCMARIITDVPAEEAPEQVKSKSNAVFGPIVQIKVNRQTGRMVYCARDSYCYRSNAFEFTTPCRIKRDESRSDGSYFSYFTR